jgi:cytochrome P450
MVNTIDHDFHRRRRAAMGSFFSKRSIQALEPSIQEKVDQLTGRFMDLAKSGEVVSLSAAYAGLTMDVISGYCFGESMGCLKKESFGQYYLDFFHDGPQIHPLARQFPWFQAVLFRLPMSVVGFLNPGVKTFLQFNEAIKPQIRKILSEEKSDVQSTQRTIFHEVKDSDLPPSEKTEQRLTDEASIFLGAGTETTARALAFTSYQLIQNPQMLDRLRKELKSVMPKADSAVPVSALEQLPYLVRLPSTAPHF